MPPKKKTSTQWIADHKAAWIGVLAAVVAAGIGLIKYSGTSAPVNSIAGTNNRQVAVTANQTGNTTVASSSTVAPQTVSVGENTGQFYAPQSTVINNYYAPNSNSVTKEAIEALESKLATATNKIEFTVGEVQKLAQALRDLDQRTSAIEKLPDGRTRFGDIVAGTPKALLEVADRAKKYYSAGDFQNALKEYQEVLKFFDAVPSDSYSIHDSLPPETKALYYRLAGSCAAKLNNLNTALEYAKKSDELQPGLRSKMLLTSVYANMAQLKYFQRNLAGALPLYKQAIDLYEPLVQWVNTEGSYVGYFNGTNSEGKEVSTIYTPKDELFPADVASQLYAEAAFAAYETGNKAESMDYIKKATDLAPTNFFVLSVAKAVMPATSVVK